MGFGSPNVYSNLNSRAPLARTPFFAPFPLSPPRCSSPPPRAHEAHGGEGRMFVVCHLHSLGRTNTVRKIRRLRSGSPWVRRAHVKGPGSWVLGGGRLSGCRHFRSTAKPPPSSRLPVGRIGGSTRSWLHRCSDLRWVDEEGGQGLGPLLFESCQACLVRCGGFAQVRVFPAVLPRASEASQRDDGPDGAASGQSGRASSILLPLSLQATAPYQAHVRCCKGSGSSLR